MKDYILTSPAFSGPNPPLWGIFDPGWYREHYGRRLQQEINERGEADPEILELNDLWLEQHWSNTGAAEGFSPNRFFDEGWYLRENIDVRNGVKRDGIFDAGFLHYCESGFRGRTPHWLFSEDNYFRENPDLSPHALISQGYCNGYDHYLRVGDLEKRISHIFFDPAVFQAECFKSNIVFDFTRSAFGQFLEDEQRSSLRCSWYFDPQWYLEKYPEVRKSIETGQFSGPLHHYLTNTSPGDFDPNPWFSEAHYRATSADVAAIVANGGFRNGYAHFVAFGAKELRSPHPDLDLAAFSRKPETTRALLEGKAADAFALWLSGQISTETALETETATPGQYRALDFMRADSLLPGAVRAPMDFRCLHSPKTSIIICVKNAFHALMASLGALQSNTHSDLQVIVIDTGSTDQTRNLERFARGLVILRPQHRMKHSQLLALALKEAFSKNILLMEAGVQPFPGAISAARLALQDTDISVLGGQILNLDGSVAEAGAILWRNGNLTRYGQGMKAGAPEIAFRRDVSTFTSGMLFCDASRLAECAPNADKFRTSDARYAALCLMMAGNEGRIVYDPSVLARSPVQSASDEFKKSEDRAVIRQMFAGSLSRQPLTNTPLMKARDASGRPTVLILCEDIPRLERGGQAQRALSLITALDSDGYQVTVFPLNGGDGDRILNALDFPPTVEIMSHSNLGTLGSFLEDRPSCFSSVWILGTRTLQRSSPLLEQYAACLPERGIILDTNQLHSLEEHHRRLVGCNNDEVKLLADTAGELSAAWICQSIVASNDEEADVLRRLGYTHVHVLGHSLPEATIEIPDFDRRKGLLFAFPVLNSGDAVHDGLDWFMQNVMRKLDRLLPPDATMLIAGYRGERVDFTPYGRFRRIEALEDPSHLKDAYRDRRVLIAPTRVTGGKPYEVLAAASAGLPGVLGNNIFQQLNWAEGESALNGGTSDADRFAQSVASLYADNELWTRLSAHARIQATTDASAEGFRLKICSIMADAMQENAVQGYVFAKKEAAQIPYILNPAPLNLEPQKRPEPDTEIPESDESPDTQTFSPRLGISFT